MPEKQEKSISNDNIVTKSTSISVALAIILAGAVFLAGKEIASSSVKFSYMENSILGILKEIESIESRIRQLEKK